MISQDEADKYAKMWAVPEYHKVSPGEQLASMFHGMVRENFPSRRPYRVLDAGCGAGKGALALHNLGFKVSGADLSATYLSDEAADVLVRFHEGPLWALSAQHKVDFVYCCDVMEHIPIQFTMATIQKLAEVAEVGLFFNISLVPDAFGALIGEPLHLTVQPFLWWKAHFAELGLTIIECRDLLESGVFFVTR